VAEEALFLDRRKELYERKYPETVSSRKSGGGGRRRKKNGSQNETHSAFIDDTAKKTGRGRSRCGGRSFVSGSPQGAVRTEVSGN
jgi:hypothetical protein